MKKWEDWEEIYKVFRNNRCTTMARLEQEIQRELEILKMLFRKDGNEKAVQDALKKYNLRISKAAVTESITKDLKSKKEVLDNFVDKEHIQNEVRPKLEELKNKEYDSEAIDLDKNIQIGTEIEVENIISEQVESEIIGKCPVKDVFYTKNDGKLEKMKYKKWGIDNDISLVCGVEFRSPILNSSKESMEQIEYICDLTKAIGLEVTEDCGFHVHLGIEYLGTDIEAWEKFFNIWNESEELIYKMANDVGEEIREGAICYARKQGDVMKVISANKDIKIKNKQQFMDFLGKLAGFRPIEEIMDINYDGSVILKNDEDLENFEEWQMYNSDRACGLNLKNSTNKRKKTVEFRISNGTTDPKVIKENILLYGKLFEISKKLSKESKEQPEGPLNKKYNKLMNRDLTEAEKVEALLDLLFEDEKQKKVYRDRWDSVKDNLIYDNFKANNPTFKRRDYTINNPEEDSEERYR